MKLPPLISGLRQLHLHLRVVLERAARLEQHFVDSPVLQVLLQNEGAALLAEVQRAEAVQVQHRVEPGATSVKEHSRDLGKKVMTMNMKYTHDCIYTSLNESVLSCVFSLLESKILVRAQANPLCVDLPQSDM